MAHPGWRAAARSGRAGGAREAVGSPRGVAVGVPESSSMLGMMLLPFLPFCTAIGGLNRFWSNVQKPSIYSKISVFCVFVILMESMISREFHEFKFFKIVPIVMRRCPGAG